MLSFFEQEDDFVSPDDETEEIEEADSDERGIFRTEKLIKQLKNAAELPSLEKITKFQCRINSLVFAEMKISPENFARAFFNQIYPYCHLS